MRTRPGIRFVECDRLLRDIQPDLKNDVERTEPSLSHTVSCFVAKVKAESAPSDFGCLQPLRILASRQGLLSDNTFAYGIQNQLRNAVEVEFL